MAPKHKNRDAGNPYMPQRSCNVLFWSRKICTYNKKMQYVQSSVLCVVSGIQWGLGMYPQTCNLVISVIVTLGYWLIVLWRRGYWTFVSEKNWTNILGALKFYWLFEKCFRQKEFSIFFFPAKSSIALSPGRNGVYSSPLPENCLFSFGDVIWA